MEDLRKANFKDVLLTCVDCGNTFIFTKGERYFYTSKGLTIPPKRCKACRNRRRKSLVPEEVSHEND